MNYPKDVLDHHLKCFGEAASKAIFGDCSSDAGVIHARRVNQRPGCNRAEFQHIVSEFTKLGTQSTCERVRRRDRSLQCGSETS
jgi:hypothetical protein